MARLLSEEEVTKRRPPLQNATAAQLCLRCSAYLEKVTLGEMEGAGRDVDAFPGLDLDAVDALMVVVVIHGIVG